MTLCVTAVLDGLIAQALRSKYSGLVTHPELVSLLQAPRQGVDLPCHVCRLYVNCQSDTSSNGYPVHECASHVQDRSTREHHSADWTNGRHFTNLITNSHNFSLFRSMRVKSHFSFIV